MMRRILVVLLASAELFGLSAIAVAPHAADPPLVRKEVVLDGMTLALSILETNARRVSVRGDRITIDFAKNMRLQRLLILKRGASPEGGPLGSKRELRWP